MTYVAERKRLGRQPTSFVELDLDYCEHTYAVAPCMAVLGVTGVDRCYNARKHCQNADNYSPAIKTYRFGQHIVNDAAVIPSYPALKQISVAPVSIDPGGSLGLRANVTVKLKDFTIGDNGVDKYVTQRATPARGTFFGRFLARNPYYQNRIMRVRTGFLTTPFSWDNFQTRTYIIDQITGPDSDGNVTIVGKDILKMADNDRAQCPLANTGVLLADISAVDVTLTLTPAGIGDIEYEESGIIRISNECMTFTRVADVMTVARATNNTVAEEHSENDSVQQCKSFTNMLPNEIAAELLTDFCGVDPSFIDTAAWDAEGSAWLSTFRLSTLLTKPEGVKTLLTELIQQGLGYWWWSEIQGLIDFKAIRPVVVADQTVITDAMIVKDSFTVKEDTTGRLTDVWVFFARIDPTKDLNAAGANFRGLYVTQDLAAASPAEYGDTRIKQILSRWYVASTGRTQSAVLGSRMLARYRNNVKVVELEMDAKDADIWTGDLVTLTTKNIQDENGDPDSIQMQVIEAREAEMGTRYKYKLVSAFFNGRYGFVCPAGQPDYTAATVDAKNRYCWVAPNTGAFANGDEAYKVV